MWRNGILVMTVAVCGVVGQVRMSLDLTRYGPSLRFGPLFMCGFYTVR